jgi:hypothetical protein
MVSQIIDKHFTDNIKYYEYICFKLCRNDLYADLLNETYLKLRSTKDDVIIRYNEQDRLKNLVIYYIRRLFQDRDKIKLNSNGSTNQLYQHQKLPINIPDYEYEDIYVTDDKLNYVITKSLSNPNQSVPVIIFLQANETSILELSKKSKLSRPYLTKKYKEGKQILYNQLK